MWYCTMFDLRGNDMMGGEGGRKRWNTGHKKEACENKIKRKEEIEEGTFFFFS